MHTRVCFLKRVGLSVRGGLIGVASRRLLSTLPSDTVNTNIDDLHEFKYISEAGFPLCPYKLESGGSQSGILAGIAKVDPFGSIKEELDAFSANITRNVTSHDQQMTQISRYLLDAQGKRFRPAILLLLAKAIEENTAQTSPVVLENKFSASVDTALNSILNHSELQKGVQEYTNVEEKEDVMFSKCGQSSNAVLDSIDVSSTLERQKRLGEIVEQIHVASQYHDDVIDNSTLRRGRDSANVVFGSRNAVLSGVYLQARASIIQCRLQNHRVTCLISILMDNLVKGEVLQMKDGRIGRHAALHKNQDLYITKTYYKTASLIANSCHGVAILHGASAEIEQIARVYGQYIGIAFQIIDDILDFTGTSEDLGKPGMNDLREGIATAPVLYAAAEYPEMYDLMERKFKHPGDIDRAVELIHLAQGLEKSTKLAEKCVECAAAAILQLPASDAQQGLLALLSKVLTRQK